MKLNSEVIDLLTYSMV